jgi:hypothetical protein
MVRENDGAFPGAEKMASFRHGGLVVQVGMETHAGPAMEVAEIEPYLAV